eukprot:11550024-Alexandrium_andersonii.AAC.1
MCIRDSTLRLNSAAPPPGFASRGTSGHRRRSMRAWLIRLPRSATRSMACLLYTSDAADDM